MSLYELINKGANSYPPAWSNLKIKSLEVNSITVLNPPVGSTKNVYVSDAGSDSNDGLTALTPVLTMVKAISVAAEYSAVECVINVSGVVGIGNSPAPANTGFDKVLDFSALSQNYQLITIMGERSDELSFDAGVSTSVPASPFDKWADLTDISGLVSGAYTKGIIHKKDGASQDFYCCAIANNTFQATAASDKGTSIAADGFEIYNVGSSVLYDNSKYVIGSEIPIIFRDMGIQGPTSTDDFMLSLIELQFYGCKFVSQAPSGFILGNIYLYGCVDEATNYGDRVFRKDAQVDADSVNFQKCYENFNLSRNWSDVHGTDCSIEFNSSAASINRMLLATDSANYNVAPLILSDSNVTLFSSAIELDGGNQPSVYMVSSTLYSREGIDVQKYTGGTQAAVLCEDGCFFKVNGDCIIQSVATNAVRLQNSRFSVNRRADASPYFLIESTNEFAISAGESSAIILDEQATKNIYGIVSAAKEAVWISDCSQLIVNSTVANGPSFSSPGGFAMIKSNYGSKVVLGSTNYANSGAGNSTVLNGITVTNVNASGCAQDIALSGTGITATAQHCHVIIK